MSVSPANEYSLEVWEAELDQFIESLELLEYALKITKNLAQGRNAADTIQIAIDDVNIAASKAALKVGRLRRKKENS